MSGMAGDTARFQIVHRTEYQYGASMIDGYTVAHLLPRETPWQRVEAAEVLITPDADEYEESVDVFGNRVVRIGVHHAHERLGVVGRCTVAIDVPSDQAIASSSVAWDTVAAQLADARGDLAVDIGRFVAATDATPSLEALTEFTAGVFAPGRPLVDAVRELSRRINESFLFDAGFSDVSTPLAAVIAARRGVCQDFAHLALACLRMQGLAARYVSGYIETLPPPGEPKLVGTDASHAWVSVWVPGFGWLDADPTNDQVPPQRHVTVAWGRDYFDVTPVRGVVIGPAAGQSLDVGVDVTAL
jgi:transglutaminase-like putative cysteine protease